VNKRRDDGEGGRKGRNGATESRKVVLEEKDESKPLRHSNSVLVLLVWSLLRSGSELFFLFF
jgi:hypothetical protein